VANTRDVLKAIAPEFASETDDTLDLFIGLAAQTLDASVWPSAIYQQAVAYLAAHKLTIRDRGQQQSAQTGGGGAAGPVESVSTGDLSVGYGSASGFSGGGAGTTALGQTHYGQQFLELSEKVTTTPHTLE